jgi:hypothetical protein
MIGGETKAMRLELDDYRDSATKGTVDFLYRLSDLVKGRSFLQINGGGVTSSCADVDIVGG